MKFMNNAIAEQRPKFSVALQSDAYKNLINNTLGDADRAKRFVAMQMLSIKL